MNNDHNYWKFWLGQSISQLGSAASAFVLPLIAYELTGSVLSLAGVAVVTFLPYPLFGLLIGAWTDRHDRKQLMVVADLMRALLQLSLPLTAILGWLTLWQIYLVAGINSTLALAFDAAGFAAVPSLVEADELVTANTRLTVGVQMATVLGPSAATLMLTTLTAGWVLVFDAVTYLVSSLSLIMVTRSFNPASEAKSVAPHGQSLWAAAKEGLGFLWHMPMLRVIIISLAVFNFFNAPIQAQIIAFARHELGASDAQIGLYYTVESIGMMALPLVVGRLQRLGLARLTVVVLFLVGLINTLLPVMHSLVYTILAGALTAGLGTILIISSTSLRQQLTPPEMYGRVAATTRTLSWSIIPLGNLVFGAFAQWSGNLSLTYLVMGLGCAATPLIVWPLLNGISFSNPPPQPTTTTINANPNERR